MNPLRDWIREQLAAEDKQAAEEKCRKEEEEKRQAIDAKIIAIGEILDKWYFPYSSDAGSFDYATGDFCIPSAENPNIRLKLEYCSDAARTPLLCYHSQHVLEAADLARVLRRAGLEEDIAPEPLCGQCRERPASWQWDGFCSRECQAEYYAPAEVPQSVRASSGLVRNVTGLQGRRIDTGA